MPQGYHPNVAAPGGCINFLWMMAATREQEDRLFGVVNVHPDFSGVSSGIDAGRARAVTASAFDLVRPRRARHGRLARARRCHGEGAGGGGRRRRAHASSAEPTATATRIGSRRPRAAARRRSAQPADNRHARRHATFNDSAASTSSSTTPASSARADAEHHSRRGLGRGARDRSDQRVSPVPGGRPHMLAAAAARSSTSRRCWRFRAASACRPTRRPRAASRS